ncbi:MAG TPA: rhodanese-like domain-containing protein [Verrucomicrobiae bacterium]|jgi:rhodanese-related sulfurtransferase|nr:rhodanese-like domain-containing protein [Verrucomicrobiae bacterium]
MTINAQSKMSEVLEKFPGAQRAMFRKYHIGGCASCGFQPTETLAQVCARNGNLNVDEVMAHIQSSHEQDEKVFVSAADLAKMRGQNPALKILDVRSREEFEATHIEGALLMSQPVVQEIMAHWPRTEEFVIVDHTGKLALDAAAYFLGHGFEQVRCLRGGIDAWAREVDSSVRRYQLA